MKIDPHQDCYVISFHVDWDETGDRGTLTTFGRKFRAGRKTFHPAAGILNLYN